VLCAFGGLIAVLWAAVAAFEVLTVPPVKGHRTLPKWEWHNRHFGLAVGVVFLDTICLLPACFLFVLHSQGQDAFAILTQLAPGDLAIIAVHLFVAILLGLVQLCSIVHTSRQLHLYQDALEAHSSTALPFMSKVLVASKLTLDVVFTILLIVIAVATGGNSDGFMCNFFRCYERCACIVSVPVVKGLERGSIFDALATRPSSAMLFFVWGILGVLYSVFVAEKICD